MRITDNLVRIILIGTILIYTIILVLAILQHGSLKYVCLLNAGSSLSVLIYWVNKQLRITQHYYERREMTVLGMEAIFLFAAFYTFLSGTTAGFLRLSQFIVFGLHFTALLLFLVYMLMFKMKKLF